MIQEVQTFKYLGLMFNIVGTYKDCTKELSRKSRTAANKVRGLGERRICEVMCEDNFIRRWTLFRYLVQSVMS